VDANGVVTATLVLPSNLEAGAHTLTLQASDGSVVWSFTITAAPATSSPGSAPGSLAFTGFDALSVTLAALTLILAGAFLLVMLVRKPRAH
jgi:hypothetical protein